MTGDAPHLFDPETGTPVLVDFWTDPVRFGPSTIITEHRELTEAELAHYWALRDAGAYAAANAYASSRKAAPPRLGQ